MPYSMTGFSKVEMDTPEGKIYGEARSLNSRYLEINVKFPKIDYAVELRLREMARHYINRGKVDITFKWERAPGFLAAPKINEENVRQYVNIIQQIKKTFRSSPRPSQTSL